jgi:hypothetical protein
MPMNVLRKLSTLIKAMASRGTGDRPAEAAPTQVHGAGVVPAAEEAQRADVQRQPLDRSRVADLLERQQAPDKDAPAQRKKGDRS